MSAEDPRAAHRSTPAELQARLAAQRSGLAHLELRDAEGAQHLVVLDPGDGARSIGRDPHADIPIAWDGQVSRLHAVLEPAAGTWTVADDGLSRNGTYVNHARVSGRRRLADGDLLRVGDTTIAYAQAGGAPTAAETSLAGQVDYAGELSRAQRRVLVELCRPLHAGGAYAGPATNADIAAAVFLSEVAVKAHLRTLYAKFGLAELPQNRKRAALAEAALAAGVVGERDFG